MKSIPPHLASRFKEIFSPEEIITLGEVFALEKRAVSFRVNTLKSSCDEIENILQQYSIEYSILDFPKNCFLLTKKFSEADLWKLDIYTSGKIYLQNISSQVPVHFFSSKIKPKRILDACAAPGGKTSQLSELYPEAEIFAFEPHKIRFEKMQHNFKKLGCENIISFYDAVENIKNHIKEDDYFDAILIDAPCSGEGSLLYNNTKFLENWDESHIGKNYKRQKRICDAVLPYLKEGGEIIYSTCTIAPEENEGVVHYLLCHYPELKLKNIDLLKNKHIKHKRAMKSFGKYIFRKEISEQTIRVIPSEYSEGFYISKFKKGVTL